MGRWWKENSDLVAAAVDEAERSSGHQILVWVGDLGWRSNRTADRIAARYSGASLVFCIDPRHRTFELRWAQGLQVESARITDAARDGLAAHDIPRAVRAVAALLPKKEEGAELPDIVED